MKKCFFWVIILLISCKWMAYGYGVTRVEEEQKGKYQEFIKELSAEVNSKDSKIILEEGKEGIGSIDKINIVISETIPFVFELYQGVSDNDKVYSVVEIPEEEKKALEQAGKKVAEEFQHKINAILEEWKKEKKYPDILKDLSYKVKVYKVLRFFNLQKIKQSFTARKKLLPYEEKLQQIYELSGQFPPPSHKKNVSSGRRGSIFSEGNKPVCKNGVCSLPGSSSSGKKEDSDKSQSSSKENESSKTEWEELIDTLQQAFSNRNFSKLFNLLESSLEDLDLTPLQLEKLWNFNKRAYTFVARSMLKELSKLTNRPSLWELALWEKIKFYLKIGKRKKALKLMEKFYHLYPLSPLWVEIYPIYQQLKKKD